MALSILNNISSLMAQNQLSLTGAGLQRTLQRLSSGSKINSGADDAAGLAIADGMGANIAAMTQSAQNAANSTGLLQTADGALSQVTALLQRAVTLATESSNGTLLDTQRTAVNAEFTAIKNEIDNIAGKTTFNGNVIFTDFVAATPLKTELNDASGKGDSSITATIAKVDTTTLAINANTLDTAANASTALAAITTAIATVAADRGSIGATMNQLTAASNVMSNQVQNLTSAQDGLTAANIGQEVANMTKFNVLQQTGIAALQQSNQAQQSVLKLLQ
jgi:flagellin